MSLLSMGFEIDTSLSLHSFELHCSRIRVRASRSLIAETRARLFPLALSAPEVALVHAIYLTTLLVVGARPPAWTARRPVGPR